MSKLFFAMLGYLPWVTVAIVCLLALKRLAPRVFSARMYRFAWLVLALRMALPFDFSLPQAPVQGNLPIVAAPKSNGDTDFYWNYAPAAASANAQNGADKAGAFAPAANGAASASGTNGAASASATAQAPINITKLMQALPFVWFLGAVLSAAFCISAYLHYAHKLRKTRVLCTEGAVYDAACGRLPVYQSAQISTPLLLGFIRPALYVGTQAAPADDARFIAAHELTHYQKGDLWVKLVLVCARAVLWFNPFAYWMVRAAGRDIEAACDEAVLANACDGERRAYGEAVLRAMQSAAKQRIYAAAFGSGTHTKQRFADIIDSKKRRRGTGVAALVLALCIAASLLVSCAPKAGNADAIIRDDLPQITISEKNGGDTAAYIDVAYAMLPVLANVYTTDTFMRAEDFAHKMAMQSAVGGAGVYSASAQDAGEYIALFAPCTTEESMQQLFQNGYAQLADSFAVQNRALLLADENSFAFHVQAGNPNIAYTFKIHALKGDKLYPYTVNGTLRAAKGEDGQYRLESIDDTQKLRDFILSEQDAIPANDAQKKLYADAVEKWDAKKKLNGLEQEKARIEAQMAAMPAGGDQTLDGYEALLEQYKASLAEWQGFVANDKTQGTKPAASGAQGAADADAMQWPLPDYSVVSTRFGKGNHTGLDIAAEHGKPIYAAEAGVVDTAVADKAQEGAEGWENGIYLVLDHGSGLKTMYAHCSALAKGIKAGDRVTKGQLLGYVGSTGLSTGNHLHFAVEKDGVFVNPEEYVQEPAKG